ncbi:Queuine tRNA-ribosyltransferase [Astathelohania contejeani]|uniref:Queuine tRNA-ribosyltransferase n=1 Tax=Astathelohania contejeani TaxID=164912 RepID=A0ABQ7HYD0_9MICR|nr:Queuine tRNA-ribosyltransferase [Thelohania contejeani]
MNLSNYAITTDRGAIPHIINPDEYPFLNKPFHIYVDDIYYKDSYYFNKGDLPINTFLNIKSSVLTFKNRKRVLNTRKGNLVITQMQYNNLIKTVDANCYTEFDSDILISTDIPYRTFIAPESLSEFVEMMGKGVLLGTAFINKMSNNYKMIYHKNGFYEVGDAGMGDGCMGYSKEYLLHLIEIKEMGVLTLLQLNNYFYLNQIYNEILNGKEVIIK